MKETKPKETYYEVPGIGLDGKPIVFKILISQPQETKKEKKKTL